MGISPLMITWSAREQVRTRNKSLKDAADFPGPYMQQPDDSLVTKRLVDNDERQIRNAADAEQERLRAVEQESQ